MSPDARRRCIIRYMNATRINAAVVIPFAMTAKNNNDAQQISYPIEQHPEPGETISVPGVRWLSMPMPVP